MLADTSQHVVFIPLLQDFLSGKNVYGLRGATGVLLLLLLLRGADGVVADTGALPRGAV